MESPSKSKSEQKKSDASSTKKTKSRETGNSEKTQGSSKTTNSPLTPKTSKEQSTTKAKETKTTATSPGTNPLVPLDSQRDRANDPLLLENTQDDSTVDGKRKKKYEPSRVISVLYPVSICMAIVLICRHIQREQNRKQTYVRSIYAVFDEGKAESDSEMIMWAVLNGLIMIAVVALMTFLMVVLYKCRCYKVLYTFFAFSTFSTLTILSVYILLRILGPLNIPASIPLVFFFALNWGVGGILAVFWKAPLLLQQMTLMSSAVFVAQMFLILLPNWTAWVVLVLLALWDLFAVLAPCGPLRMLVNDIEERDEKQAPVLTALAYTSGMVFSVDTHALPPNKEQEENSDAAVEKSPADEQHESESIKLGLGDFIFYSILIGKAAISGDYNTILACYVAIIIGLVFTLLLLIIFQQALPALPISIALGVVFHFATRHAITPVIESTQRLQVIF